MRIKICGVTDAADALLVARCGAEFVGLILAPSPRQVTLDTATRIVRGLPTGVQPVLVFRDAAPEAVRDAVSTTGCRWVQLHGREPPADLQTLHRLCPDLRVIKAWEVSGEQSGAELLAYLAEAARLGGVIDVILLDVPKGNRQRPSSSQGKGQLGVAGHELVPSPSPVAEREAGGPPRSERPARAGYALLGALSRQLHRRPPEVWCAGGLTPDNVAAALAAGQYDGVDVASGVESSPGRKDAALVSRFVEAVRSIVPPRAGQ